MRGEVIPLHSENIQFQQEDPLFARLVQVINDCMNFVVAQDEEGHIDQLDNNRKFSCDSLISQGVEQFCGFSPTSDVLECAEANQMHLYYMVTAEAALASSTPPPIFNSTTTNTTATATTLLYDSPNHGIQIRYPQDWAYIDSGNFLIGAPYAAIIFMPATDALQIGMMPLQQQQESSTAATTIDEVMPTTSVTVVTMQLPFGNMDVRLFVDYLLKS